ncbi:hypothetical protein [Caulobacter radicis]|uniref:hypothetical protein n=1 Tax=Caulobacter radicis TaxID=2172650 RepID=UPI0010576355|nr:hypothetical protein [Caulobacter radicis]
MKILPTIASGLAGWLTYEDMRRKVRHHEENTLYDPIREIAEANGYHVEREFPFPRRPGQRGDSRRIDFVFANERTGDWAVLEVKFKKMAKTMAGGIGKDALRIRDIDGAFLNAARPPKSNLPEFKPNCRLDHGVLVVWREGEILKAIANREPLTVKRQIKILLDNMFDDPKTATSRMIAEAMLLNKPRKTVDIKGGYLRWGSTRTEKRYWLAILRKTSAWSHLEDELAKTPKPPTNPKLSSGRKSPIRHKKLARQKPA